VAGVVARQSLRCYRPAFLAQLDGYLLVAVLCRSCSEQEETLFPSIVCCHAT
jgi:hypothetical protein